MNKSASLTPEEKAIILDKKTETPHQGEYVLLEKQGTYLCRQCGLALFRSSNKFISSCGWPSFDKEIDGAIKRSPDKDGIRTEVLCQRCDGHLGHVFIGEYLTKTNARHCINSLSIDFVLDEKVKSTEEAIVAGGCFWGIEALLKREAGVIKTEVGYIGGHTNHPTYDEVCRGDNGFTEAVRVLFDLDETTLANVYKAFLESHDVSQGIEHNIKVKQQYQSAIYAYNENQIGIATHLLKYLEDKGESVVTKILPVTTWWKAEIFHQDYYQRTGQMAICHRRVKRF